MHLIAANDNQPVRFGPWLPSMSVAKQSGSKHYFTGKPCIRGHVAPRHTSNGTCLDCTKDRVALWMKQNPEKAELMKKNALAKAAADYASNPGKYRNRYLAAFAADPEKFRARSRKKDRKNPGAKQARVRTRRARMAGAEGSHTQEDVEAIYARQKYKCAECGQTVRVGGHVDHIMPIALGGSNWPNNLQILCATCNQSKGALHPAVWARRQGRLL